MIVTGTVRVVAGAIAALICAGTVPVSAAPSTAASGVAAPQEDGRTRQTPGVTARAQGQRPAGPGVQGAARPQGTARVQGPAPRRTVAEVEQMFDRYVLNQARQALRLDQGQMRAFAPRLQRLQVLRRRAIRQRQALVRELGELTRADAGADEGAIAAKLQALEAQVSQSEQEVRDAYAELEQGLTVEQRARLRVFEQRMERRKLELIAQARRQVQEQGQESVQEQAP
jgi:hypothetical protein